MNGRGLALVATFAAGLVLASYWPGLSGPFLLDDYRVIVDAPGMDVRSLSPGRLRDAVFASQSVFPHRALARLSFALNHYLAGGAFDPWWFKLTNLLVHLLNGLLVGVLAARLVPRAAGSGSGAPARRVTRNVALAAMVAATIWALHPIQITGVLYVVQRMASLSAMFSLAGLVVFVYGRERFERGARGATAWMAAGILGGVAPGVLCKENAVLLPALALLVEVHFFERGSLAAARRSALRGFYVSVVGVALALGVVGLIAGWEWIQHAYDYRSFTMGERLLTQSRVLWLYASLLLVPLPSRFSLFRDDIAASTGWLDPWTTLPAVGLWALVATLALLAVRRRSMLGFAVLWFLVGHGAESSIIDLELAFEHRNYLPSAGAAIAGAVWISRAMRAYRASHVATVAGVAALALASSTFVQARVWRSEAAFAEFAVRHHPDSGRAQRYRAAALAHRGATEAEVFEQLRVAAVLDPGDLLAPYAMARMANRRRGAAGGSPEATSPAEDLQPLAMLRWSSDPRRASALYAALDAEIRRRARESVPGPNAVDVGRDLETCLGSGDPYCRRMLPDGLEWLALVSESRRLPPTSRAIAALSDARIRFDLGDAEGAKTASLRAVRALPDFMGVWLESGTLHLRVGDLDAARRLLDEADARRHWSGYGDRLLDLAYRRLAERRSTRRTD